MEGSQLRKFDVVLANPPYSIKQWDREAFMHDKWGRNFLGTPPQGRADYAFFQHILASMDDKTGRCAILFPHGVLFRDEEQSMREQLIQKDWLDCVIGLGPNLFFNASMEACVIICRKVKPNNRCGKVLFIDAKAEVTRKNAESYLEPKHITRIVEAYENCSNIEGFSKVIDNKTILANKSLIGIQYYITSLGNSKKYVFNDEYINWKAFSVEMHKEYSKLENLL